MYSVEVSVATDCTLQSEVEMEVSWNSAPFVPYPIDPSHFSAGARFEEITLVNPSLTEGTVSTFI